MSVRWHVVETDETKVKVLAEALSLPESLAHVLVGRGISDPTIANRFLEKSLHGLVSPFDLEGVSQAADRLCRAIVEKEKIFIHGDFDADGITSTALLTLFLRDLGGTVDPFVPNRLIEGHGISSRAIEIAEKNQSKLFITCDCGSSSGEELRKLKELGIDTIVTDHHLVSDPESLGTILVNPKASKDRTEYHDLAGVGVAFTLATALRSKLRDQGYFSERAEPNLKEYLDVVALGTIADLAPLLEQNRILVAKGLEQLTVSGRPGIVAMCVAAKIPDMTSIGTVDVGFRLAPRINAAARLGHADEALELLLATDVPTAEKMAKKLDGWNSERKALQAQMTRVASIEAGRQAEEDAPVLFAASDDFHPGVIGLVAQKVAEMFNTPTFVFALEGEIARGSARSRSRIDLMKALEPCGDLLMGFGGHKEACGCTLKRSLLPEFRKRFRAYAAQQGIAAAREVWIDAPLKLGHLNRGFLSSLNRLRPFGVGNPEPVFVTKAKVVGRPKEMGKGHLRVTLADEKGSTFGAVGFGMWREFGEVLQGNVEVAFTPDENEWNGRRELRVLLRNARAA